ncbi:hypothetical protein SAMN05216188_12437 [Lentzea xinjiangensis]|uniref:Uncharacterized protein n=1 Tax=Lentzea xinjiangensis TaxID=402600 RepID=A0A1H9V4N8_9PSEU|nr:hypothetical protein SAMN05216188_12437 [Lentzea xinjiangensis]
MALDPFAAEGTAVPLIDHRVGTTSHPGER